jgi:predicted DNA-binding ribbon-helix-helix protein
VRKRSIRIAGHRTSVALEAAFWEALQHLAGARGLSLAALVGEIDASREATNLASALRLHVLERAKAGALSPPE